MIGSAIAQSAVRRGFQLMAAGYTQLPTLPAPHQNFQIDLHVPDALDRIIFDTFPDVIINAAGYASEQSLATVDADKAHALNVALPERLAQLAHHVSARFYHLSSDQVFDGTTAPYRTTDMPSPQTDYAKLKAESEKQVLRYGGYESTVLRLGLINGNSPSGQSSIHERLLHRWMAGETTRLFDDEICQPTLSDNVGDLLAELCERPNLHGLFHWAGAQSLSFYEMGRRIAEHFGLPQSLVCPITRAENTAPHRGDVSLLLAPLEGKVKTRPLPFEEQLSALRVPEACRPWVSAHSSKPLLPRRFVKGVDF